MATLDEIQEGIVFGKYNDSNELSRNLKKYIKGEVTFFCIGTDRATGDSLAPFIGSMLIEKGYNNVIGTIDNPAHAQNLDKRIKEISENTTVIAIDAALGKSESIGKIIFSKGKTYPGIGVGKNLTSIGDFSLAGVVNQSGVLNYEVLRSTRLSIVLKMAESVVESIQEAFPITISDKIKLTNAQ